MHRAGELPQNELAGASARPKHRLHVTFSLFGFSDRRAVKYLVPALMPSWLYFDFALLVISKTKADSSLLLLFAGCTATKKIFIKPVAGKKILKIVRTT